MPSSDRLTVHADFRLLERSSSSRDGAAANVRSLLREAWSLPRDTFVTGEIPLLLTRLSISEARAAAADDKPAPDQSKKVD